jgi:hypothetical protein
MSSRVMPKNSAKTATRLTPTNILVSPMTLNLKGEEMPTHATVLENTAVSPMTMNLKCEVPVHSTTLEGVEMVFPIPTIASTMEAVSPMTLHSNGEEKSTHATVLEDVAVSPMTMNLKCEVPVHPTTLEGVEMVFPIQTIVSTMEAVSPMTLYSNGEEMPAHATTLEGAQMMSPITLDSNGEDMPTPATTLEGRKTTPNS